MSDLIKREDAMESVARHYHQETGCEGEWFAFKAIADIPSADRPQEEWIFHYRDKWMVKAECPKCHRRFEFSPRGIWKCCPMCETRMKGADDDEV